MCMIAYRPASETAFGSNIPNVVVDTAMQRHPDGFGVAWRENGVIKVAKYGPSGRKAFRKTLKRLDKQPTIEYAAHFRFATHGAHNAEMAHPYTYEDPEEGTVAVVHNGIINIATTPTESDTYAFVHGVLEHLPSRWWANPAIVFLVNESIGWSKIVIMTARETVNLQEADGKWDGGLWYSSEHKPYTYTGKSSSDSWAPRNLNDITKAGTTGIYGWWDDKGVYTPFPYKRKTDELAPKSAEQSAKVLIPAVAASSVAYIGQKSEVAGVTSDGQRVLESAGHLVHVITDVDWHADGDYVDGVICNECYTSGDLYVIDGSYYIDMAHKGPVQEADDDGESEYLPDEMEDLLDAEAQEMYDAGLTPDDSAIISRRARRRARRAGRVRTLVN